MKEITTYRDLLTALQALTPEQLTQQIQIAHPGPDEGEPVELMPGIALGTVDAMGFYRCRSMVDNKYHADEVVILIDGNPFSEDGAVAYSWSDAGSIEDLDEHPLYGKDGPTDIKDQTSPTRPSGTVDVENGPPMAQATVTSLKWMTGVGERDHE